MPIPLEAGRAMAESALPAVLDLEVCNSMLVGAGRPDLVMEDRAALLQISSPDEVFTRLNNFSPSFNFQIRTPVPVTEEALLRLRTEPSYVDELFNNNELGMALTHAKKPAFQRILTLFPDFTTQLVLASGSVKTGMFGPSRSDREQLVTDYFVAYQIMRQLVDKQDPWVMRNGEVDDLYFYR